MKISGLLITIVCKNWIYLILWRKHFSNARRFVSSLVTKSLTAWQGYFVTVYIIKVVKIIANHRVITLEPIIWAHLKKKKSARPTVISRTFERLSLVSTLSSSCAQKSSHTHTHTDTHTDTDTYTHTLAINRYRFWYIFYYNTIRRKN